mgnify:FL=1
MEKFKKYGGWGVGVIAVLLFGVVLVKAAVGGYLIYVENWNGGVNVADSSDYPVSLGADDGTHITKLSVLETLDVSSTVTFSGNLSVGGTLTQVGAATFTGELRAPVVLTGSIATFTATSTATAAQVCDSSHWIVTPVTTTPTLTLPTTTTLFADCLTTNGDVVELSVASVTTSTILAVGTGGNADLASTLTIALDKSVKLRFIRDSATTYLLQVTNYGS